MGKQIKSLTKPYRGRQRGDKFLASSTVTGNFQRDALKEQYLQTLIRETKTHDINDTWSNLDKEAKATIKRLRSIEKQTGKLNVNRAKLQGKLSVIGATIRILKQIQSTGATRVGESQLKTIVANVMREKGIDPRALGLKII